jgi:hypothetical protein
VGLSAATALVLTTMLFVLGAGQGLTHWNPPRVESVFVPRPSFGTTDTGGGNSRLEKLKLRKEIAEKYTGMKPLVSSGADKFYFPHYMIFFSRRDWLVYGPQRSELEYCLMVNPETGTSFFFETRTFDVSNNKLAPEKFGGADAAVLEGCIRWLQEFMAFQNENYPSEFEVTFSPVGKQDYIRCLLHPFQWTWFLGRLERFPRRGEVYFRLLLEMDGERYRYFVACLAQNANLPKNELLAEKKLFLLTLGQVRTTFGKENAAAEISSFFDEQFSDLSDQIERTGNANKVVRGYRTFCNSQGFLP